MPLYKGITLSIQGKYTKCTKLPFVKDFNQTTPLFSLSLKDYKLMSCTLFNSHMEIPMLSPIMMFGGKNFDPKEFTIFSTKPLKTWLTHPHRHITEERYGVCTILQRYYINCTREMCQVIRAYKTPNRFYMIFKQLKLDIKIIINSFFSFNQAMSLRHYLKKINTYEIKLKSITFELFIISKLNEIYIFTILLL